MIVGFQYNFWLGLFLLFVLGLLGRRSFFLFISLCFLYLFGRFGRFPALPLNSRKDGTRQSNIAERLRNTRSACHDSDDSTRAKTRRRVTLF